MGLILDSTLFIEAERSRESPAQLIARVGDRFGDVELFLSVMSAGELFHGCWRATDARRRAQREEFVESILAAVPVLPITLPIMRIFGEVDARLRSKGETLPTSDLLIACSALSQGYEVVTGNPRHFHRVSGLKVHEWR